MFVIGRFLPLFWFIEALLPRTDDARADSEQRSKPRKGHKQASHLPKVGSPANQQWEHEMQTYDLY